MFKFSRKNRLIFLLIIFFLFINIPIVWAQIGQNIGCKAIGLISPTQAIKCMFAEYGIDEKMIKENIRYANVSNLKKLNPQVTINFSSTTPNPGEELTANALPLNFSNQPKSLYYTWYLQPEYCREENLNKEVNGIKNRVRCNLNKDYDNGVDIVDVEDFKIKAMRIYASNDFEFTEADYSQSDGKSAYKAIHGGEDQQGKPNYCYFHDTELGKQYAFRTCFHLFPDAPGYETGDENFGRNEEYFWRTNPDDPDTAEAGHPDEANVSGLGAQNFTWIYQAGDSIGVVVEGISFDATAHEDSSYKIMWAVPNNTCGNLEEYIDEDELGGGEDEDTEVSPTTWPDLPDGGKYTRTLIKKIQIDNQQAPSSSDQMTTYKVFTKTEEITLASRRRVSGSAAATGGTGGTAPTGGSATIDIETTTLEMPEAPDCNTFDTYNTASGGQELYSLVNAGFITQAEAESDERFRVNLTTNSACCPPDTVFEEDETPFCSAVTTYSITESTELDIDPEDSLFTMEEDDFNKCLLEKNLLTPTEGGGKNKKLEVSLSYSPANPVNDTSTEGDNADWIKVVSTIENSTKNDSLHYQWRVFGGDSADPDPENWMCNTTTTSEITKEDLIGVEQAVGAGLPNFKFKANFNSYCNRSVPPKYLKVRLDVSERTTSGINDGTRKGHAEVIIPLSSFNNKLAIKRAAVSDALVLSPGAEICKILGAADPTVPVDAAICQIAPNEIIAVEADIVPETGSVLKDYDFLWTLNNQPLSYKYNPLHSDDTFKPGKLIYFPALAIKGSTLNLSLTATNQKTGTKISLAKTFLVSEPAFKIVSTDETTSKPKTLGNYLDLDDETREYPDYSQTDFLALENSSVKLALAQFATLPFPLEEDLPIKWYWNGTLLENEGYSLPAFDTTGLDTSFSLKAEGVYTQDRNTKRALRDYWGAALDEYYERLISQTVDFTLTDNLDGATVSQKGQGKILASFISSVPAYFAFLFRLVLTAFVLLATIWTLFSLFPQMQKND